MSRLIIQKKTHFSKWKKNNLKKAEHGKEKNGL